MNGTDGEIKKDHVLEIKARQMDKWGDDVKNKADVVSRRISIYFNYDKDNHHIQFLHDTPRYEIVRLLHELANLVEKGGG